MSLSATDYQIMDKFQIMKDFIRNTGRKLFYLFQNKHGAELRYWRKCYRLDNCEFQNDFYQNLMLGMAQEKDESFLSGQVVADFGCGPRGSLQWIKGAQAKIGIDVLADSYLRAFPQCRDKHGMQYVTSTETSIPLSDGSVDILFTLNALDHVKNLEVMCKELKRILKPGGILIGSFNLNHIPQKAEPQTLTEDKLRQLLFGDFKLTSWRVSAQIEGVYQYRNLLDDTLISPQGRPATLWVRGQKL